MQGFDLNDVLQVEENLIINSNNNNKSHHVHNHAVNAHHHHHHQNHHASANVHGMPQPRPQYSMADQHPHQANLMPNSTTAPKNDGIGNNNVTMEHLEGMPINAIHGMQQMMMHSNSAATNATSTGVVNSSNCSSNGVGATVGSSNMKYVRYSSEQVEALERLYRQCPKPTLQQRLVLVRDCPPLCNIDPQQIKVWFQNRRCREKQRKESARLQCLNGKLTAMNTMLMDENMQLQQQVAQLLHDNKCLRHQLNNLHSAMTMTNNNNNNIPKAHTMLNTNNFHHGHGPGQGQGHLEHDQISSLNTHSTILPHHHHHHSDHITYPDPQIINLSQSPSDDRS